MDFRYLARYQPQALALLRIVTGLLFLSAESRDLHDQSNTVPAALTTMPYEQLCPGSAELERLQQRFR